MLSIIPNFRVKFISTDTNTCFVNNIQNCWLVIKQPWNCLPLRFVVYILIKQLFTMLLIFFTTQSTIIDSILLLPVYYVLKLMTVSHVKGIYNIHDSDVPWSSRLPVLNDAHLRLGWNDSCKYRVHNSLILCLVYFYNFILFIKKEDCLPPSTKLMGGLQLNISLCHFSIGWVSTVETAWMFVIGWRLQPFLNWAHWTLY